MGKIDQGFQHPSRSKIQRKFKQQQYKLYIFYENSSHVKSNYYTTNTSNTKDKYSKIKNSNNSQLNDIPKENSKDTHVLSTHLNPREHKIKPQFKQHQIFIEDLINQNKQKQINTSQERTNVKPKETKRNRSLQLSNQKNKGSSLRTSPLNQPNIQTRKPLDQEKKQIYSNYMLWLYQKQISEPKDKIPTQPINRQSKNFNPNQKKDKDNHSQFTQQKSDTQQMDRSPPKPFVPKQTQNTTINGQCNQQKQNNNFPIDKSIEQQIVNQNKENLKQGLMENEMINTQQDIQKLDGMKVTETGKNLLQSTHIKVENENNIINKKENQIQKIEIQYLGHCDCIQLQSDTQNKNIFFVQSQFTLYKGEFDIKTAKKEGKGCILQKLFDKDFNSSYFHYEGQFKNDQIFGNGTLFNQKSKEIRGEGEWMFIKTTLSIQPQITIKTHKTKIKICKVTNHTTGISEKPIPYRREFHSNSTTGFHDQLLNLNDLNILKSNKWLNSSIIDAYVGHLNYNDEVQYWTLIKEDRKLHKRLQIIPSWLFSWFHQGQDYLNLKYFKEIYSQFEPIQYRIWEIYKKIGFVINSSNVHWYFVQLDFDTMEMIIKDSMRGGEQKYETTVNILQNLLQKIDKNISFTVKVCEECQQQRNGYDCGAYTCMNANEMAMAEDTMKRRCIALKMRQFLLELFQSKN